MSLLSENSVNNVIDLRSIPHGTFFFTLEYVSSKVVY